MKNPILSLQNVSLSFGFKPLFDGLNIVLYPKDRVCLVGRNGEGKSSLMKLIHGDYEPDSGESWISPDVDIGYLPQSIEHLKPTQTVFQFVTQDLKSDEVDDLKYLADIIITPLKLNHEDQLGQLSGGMLRRVSLAKTLLQKPKVLLLDEPTNHLDIDTIEWLEDYVNQYAGAIITISHDKQFLKNVSNKTYWLDRGKVKTNNQGYAEFDKWSLVILEQEERELVKLSKKLQEEERWKVEGISARRKRNQGRLKALFEMREKMSVGKSARRNLLNKIQLDQLDVATSSKMVCEFRDVNKKYQSNKILDSFSMRIMRGDRIGIVGPNGTGKTTFLKILVGDDKPDTGYIKLGKTVTITYYDQKRTTLDGEETLKRILCPNGGDHVNLGDRMLHVAAYLKNFLFDPKSANDKVSTLSGGQANRLLLAKALADPGQLLILDEPTNDLDMDTLEMIKEILYSYNGTLIIVSHDRDFLDSLITKTIYFEGNGVIEEFVGSYSDLKKLKSKPKVKESPKQATKITSSEGKKLTYILQRELDLLPDKITDLDEEILKLEAILNQPDLYQQDIELFNQTSKQLSNIRHELENAWSRWAEIERMKKKLKNK